MQGGMGQSYGNPAARVPGLYNMRQSNYSGIGRFFGAPAHAPQPISNNPNFGGMMSAFGGLGNFNSPIPDQMAQRQSFPIGDQGSGVQVGMTKPMAIDPGQLQQPRMMDTGSMLPQNPMLAAYAQSNPGGPQNTNGYTLPPGNTSMFSSNPAPYGMSSITTPGDRPGFAPGQMAPNGSMVVRNPATGRLEYAGHSGVPGMNGTWQDDYRDRFGNVGPAQTINGQNFIGDRLYNAEGLNQGGLGGFNSLANFYGLLGR